LSPARPYLEKAHHRKGLVAQGVGPEFKPHFAKRQKRKVIQARHSKMSL
jgi:hypothetical protein